MSSQHEHDWQLDPEAVICGCHDKHTKTLSPCILCTEQAEDEQCHLCRKSPVALSDDTSTTPEVTPSEKSLVALDDIADMIDREERINVGNTATLAYPSVQENQVASISDCTSNDTPSVTGEEEICNLVETALAETQKTTSDNPITHLIWLIDGLAMYHQTNGKRGHSLEDCKRYLASQAVRLIVQVRAAQKAEDNNRVVQAQINTVEAEYDALYNLLPTGNVDAWHLLKALQAHLVRLQDMSKELRSYLTNPQESKQ